ncbi:TPA: hypothetical protein ACX6RU_000613 [Photobacterium damselae]
MKYIYIFILLLLSPCLTFAKVISHTFEVSSIIDISSFGDSLAITGKDGLLPIDNGEIFINYDGTFTSNDLILEAHKIDNGIIDSNKYPEDTVWSLITKDVFVDSVNKKIDLIVSIDNENFIIGDKFKDEDSSVTLQVKNIEKIDGLTPGQTITAILTIVLEASI